MFEPWMLSLISNLKDDLLFAPCGTWSVREHEERDTIWARFVHSQGDMWKIEVDLGVNLTVASEATFRMTVVRGGHMRYMMETYVTCEHEWVQERAGELQPWIERCIDMSDAEEMSDADTE